MGGLGNQLFQYAFGRCLATQWNTDLVLDLDFLLDRTERDNFVFRDFDLDLFRLKPYQLKQDVTKKQFLKNQLLNLKNKGLILQNFQIIIKKQIYI